MENASFTVLPMSQRFSLEPGKTYSGRISVVNPANASKSFFYNASVLPYGVTDGDYTADLATRNNRTLIVDWVTILEPSGEVSPNETREIEFTITVPETAPAGGQYAAIAVSFDTDDESSDGVMVDSVFELASLIYADVAGETVRSGEILENNVPSFVLSTPVTLSALISNGGNVHEDATFLISVSNVFTGEVILPNEESSGRFNELIMPETTRLVMREVNDLPAFGVVNVKQTVYYQGEVSEVSRDVVICPIWFMALVVATFVAIVVAIIGIIIKYKHKRRAV